VVMEESLAVLMIFVWASVPGMCTQLVWFALKHCDDRIDDMGRPHDDSIRICILHISQ